MTLPPFSKLFLLLSVFLVFLFNTRILGQDNDQKPADVELKVETANGQTQFHTGEVIPLKLSFTSSAPKKYQINMASYDRSGRMNYEGFHAEPEDGWSDPLKLYFSGGFFLMGGLTNFKYLSQEPFVLPLDLNEWVRFDKPGKYMLRIVSRRVADVSNKEGGKDVALTSNELQITIVPATKKWQDETLKSAIAILDKDNQTDKKSNPRGDLSDEKQKAVKILRYLDSADAIKELAKRLADYNGQIGSQCFFGLVGSSSPAVAISELQRLLTPPDYPIVPNYFFALSTLMRDPDQPPEARIKEDARNRDAILEKLLPAFSRKQGRALALTLTTVLEMTGKDEHVSDEMVKQVAAIFDQLPIEKQTALLESRWDLVKGPAFLPLLRKYALLYKDFPVLNESNAYDSLHLSVRALLRWYELEPTEARPVIIREILRPKPRYSAGTLGILPDETLPEVEQTLAANLAVEDGHPENVASLINRYATDSIMPQVLAVADKHIGKWACAIQEPILAYLLRVDPEAARPRLEAAIAARGEGFTACNHQLFLTVGDLRQDPLLEELAIRALEDDDPQVAIGAALYLGKYGSAAAEQKLWDCLTQWNEKWKDKPGELRYVMAGDNPNQYQRSLGTSLVDAIRNAKSWNVDENKLRRLRQLAVMPDVQEQLDNSISEWAKKLWTITFMVINGEQSFEVLRYRTKSMKAIQEKLAHFPPGSTFVWSAPFAKPDDDSKKVMTELSEFLSSHGMKLITPSN